MLHGSMGRASFTNRDAMVDSVSDAGWSSQVARRAHNPKVAGSNPAPATMVRAVAPLAVTPQIVSALSVFRVFLIQFISAMKPLIRIRGQCEEQERARRPTQLQPLALLAKPYMMLWPRKLGSLRHQP